MTDPLYIDRNGHRTWLKWHRARRRAGDPAFTGTRILEGLRLGASIEVDLVVHGDHGLAVLHNLTLGAETDGTGTVRNTGAEALRALHLRDDDGRILPDRVMVLEDLCAMLTRDPPHPDALLQLDYKEDRTALDAETLGNFGATIAALGGHMIVSGGDFAAVDALTRAAPGLQMGYDPCHGGSLDRLRRSGDFAGWIAAALDTAPRAVLIYLAHEIVVASDVAGFDLIGAVHVAGRRVDAYTIQTITPASLIIVRRLLALKADQITTDDPEGLLAALSS